MTRTIDALTAADWTRLDNEFDALLELAPDEQQRRLAAMAPADAALLRRLLAEEADDTRLHHHLESALRFLAKQESLASGTELGPWRIVRPIGRGGMAEVYLAERADGAFERQVALKVLWPGLVTPGAEEQVRQERQILANLEDPRIADLVDGGVSHDGRPWLAMERVEGRPITEACRDRPLKDRVALLIQVAEAVASAHRQLVVHGDIKPSNVLVTEAGQVRLLDFGIGRLLGGGSGDTAGRSDPGGAPGGAPGRPRWRALTPSSSSPEQRAGHPPTPSSDIYQLGLLMGAVLEGARRGSARKGHELAAIEGRATAAAPKDRYAGADRFAADLSAFDAQRPVAALEGGATYRLRCFARRRWGALTA
ncbi:MAG: serine/threonine-protein kinase, partial [Myxococcota bacterium]